MCWGRGRTAPTSRVNNHVMVNKTHFTLKPRPHLPNNNTHNEASVKGVMKSMATMTASGAIDAPLRAFPFLALPKELRLITYEFIFESFIRTHQELSRSPGSGLHPCLEQKHRSPALTISLVVETMSVGVLRTCKQVYTEAVVVLRTASKAFRRRPIKVFVTTGALRSSYLLDVLGRLGQSSQSFCGAPGIESDEILFTSQPAQVQVAVRNEFANRRLGNIGTAEDMWSYLRMHILRVHYEGILYEADTLRCNGYPSLARDLNITFRMALMSPAEKKEFEKAPPFEQSTARARSSHLQIQGGEEIGLTEWEEDWAASWTPSKGVVNDPEGLQGELIKVRKSCSRTVRFLHAMSGRWKVLYERWNGRGQSK